MAFDPTQVHFGRARLNALVALLQANVGLLSDAIAAEDTTAYLVGDEWGGALTDSIVDMGSVALPWDSSTGCLRLRVFGAMMPNAAPYFKGERQGLGVEFGHSEQTWHTNILVSFHEQAGVVETDAETSRTQTVLTELVSDVLLWGILNAGENSTLWLSSNTFGSTPFYDADDNLLGYDRLDRCFVTSAFNAPFTNGFDNASRTLNSLHFVHVGYVNI